MDSEIPNQYRIISGMGWWVDDKGWRLTRDISYFMPLWLINTSIVFPDFQFTIVNWIHGMNPYTAFLNNTGFPWSLPNADQCRSQFWNWSELIGIDVQWSALKEESNYSCSIEPVHFLIKHVYVCVPAWRQNLYRILIVIHSSSKETQHGKLHFFLGRV